MRPTLSHEEAVRQTPLSDRGKKQLLRVMQGGQHSLEIPRADLPEYIRTNDFFGYLIHTLGVDDPAVLRMARHTAMDYEGLGTDVMSIAEALATGPLGAYPYTAWPDALAPGAYTEYVNPDGDTYTSKYPFIHHFPDGNATIARMLVKKLVPDVGPGKNAEEIVLSRFRYSELDKPGNRALSIGGVLVFEARAHVAHPTA